jgi:phospholipid transport system substrate-binding protein
MTTISPMSRPTDAPTRRALLLGAASLAALASGPLPATADDASSFIKRVGDEVVAILARTGADDKARLAALVDVLNKATDLALVGRLVLGKYWRSANEAQRTEYTELFRALVVKAMADRLHTFGGYGGETFELAGDRPIDERDTLVSTKIFRPNAGGQPILVDWRVRSHNGGFAIIDIVAEGISMVVTQRSEVNSVVGQKGMDGLLEAMRERLQQQA